jgi:ABC-type transporter Mla subunit MlaD
MLFAQVSSIPVTISTADLDQAISLFKVLGSLILILGVFVLVLKVVDFFRSKPPLYREYATKAELGQLKEATKAEFEQLSESTRAEFDRQRVDLALATTRLNEAHGAIFAKLDDLSKSVNESFNQMFKDVGKLEGRNEVLQVLKEHLHK